MSLTHTQLNGVTSKADLASPAFTGTPTAPTATTGTATTQIATTAFVAATALSTALPGQVGNSGKVITTDGTNASWTSTLSSITLTGPLYTLTALGNSGTSTQTLTASSASTYTLTATGAFTIAFSGFTSGKTGYIQLLLTNGGSQTITWPTVSWIKPDGTTTTSISTYLSSLTGRTALQTSGVDQFVFWSNDGGTTTYGKLV